MLIGAYFLQRAFDYRILTVLLVLTAMGAMGVGVFTEDFGPIHSVVSLMAFLFGGLATIFSAVCSRVNQLKLLKMPFSVIVAALGLMSLGSLVLFIAKVDLGLGFGGMERMIVYPLLVWGAGFGGHLIGLSEDQAIQQKSKSS